MSEAIECRGPNLYLLDEASCLVVEESVLKRAKGSRGGVEAFDVLIGVVRVRRDTIWCAIYGGGGSRHFGRPFRRRTLRSWKTHGVSSGKLGVRV